MNSALELMLIVIAVGLVWVARARNGEPARFLKS